MTIFFTSDNHIGHSNILKYCPNRGDVWGEDVLAMNDGLRKNWNRVVQPGDTVYLLGDVTFDHKPDRAAEYLNSLNGKKHLVFGNHDKIIKKNKELFSSVFESMQDYLEVSINGQHVCLFHFAPRVWNKSHRGSWCLWGHSHGGLPPWGLSVDVGIDSRCVTGQYEHRPFSFDEIKSFMEKQKSDIVANIMNGRMEEDLDMPLPDTGE